MSTQTQRITLRLLFTTIFLLIVIMIAWLALSQIKDESKKNIRESLYTVNQITKEAIDIWISHKKYDIVEFIKHHSIASLTQELLTNKKTSKEIITSTDLKKIRKLLLDSAERHKHQGFFIITPDMKNVAAMNDTSIGKTNVIYKQRPRYLERVFKGETLFIPTIHSYDVDMSAQTTIFIAVPLQNNSNNIIAALVFRLDPTNDFTKITQLGQLGNSGETYAFDDKGLLLTQSRFDNQLKKIGLISANQKSMLTLRIADPGGNMIEGYIPSASIEKRPFTFMVQNALSGGTNFNTDGYRDYRGVDVVGTWIWDDKLGIGLATEIDKSEAMNLYAHTKSTIFIVLILTIILSFGLLFLLLKLEQKSKLKLRNAYEQLEDKVEQRTKEFKESEEKFRTIFESSSDALILLNKTSFIDCNDAALNMFLCEDKEEFLNSLHSRWSAKEQTDTILNHETQLKKKMAQAFRRGELAYEWNYIRSNGDVFPAEVLLTSIYMNEEKVLQGTIRDI
ncbi:MAG: PAS domain-containing protein, partial [Campylobacteraceae bacterium]|nr:PAS domain-containing protein [Campylobacteraceae bacterium]